MNRGVAAAVVAVAYVACVVLANVLTEHLGLVPVAFGLVTTAGTYAAGATLLARNIAQSLIGRLPVLALIGVGIALSWWLASPALAVASAVAFALSETTDMAVFTSIKGWSRAALASASVAAVVDTFVFLHLAGFPVTTESVAGQLVVKIGVSVVAVALRGVACALFRQSVRAGGA